MEQTGNTGKQEKKKMVVPKGKHAFECSGKISLENFKF